LISNPGNGDTPLQLPSVHHNPSCAEDSKDNVKRGFGQQHVAKERLGVI